jgi:predicted DCC family thiol-disulfide oxidoreductase YuxK
MTPRQRQFVAEWLVDRNATKAAIRAGYTARTAYAQGHRLLKKAEIRAAIASALGAQEERTQINADAVLLSIQRIGDEAWLRGDWAAALRSRELLGRYFKLVSDRVEVNHFAPRADRLRQARERRSKSK